MGQGQKVIDVNDVILNEEGKRMVKQAQEAAKGQPYIVGNEKARLDAFNQELAKLCDSYQVVMVPCVEIEPGMAPRGFIKLGIKKQVPTDVQ